MDDHEEFRIIHLNNGNFVVNVHHVSSGGETATFVDVKMVVRNTLQVKTQAVILMYNHPSGTTKFSQGDRDVTNKLKRALEYFDIPLLDSLIITRETYVSMADDGIL